MTGDTMKLKHKIMAGFVLYAVAIITWASAAKPGGLDLVSYVAVSIAVIMALVAANTIQDPVVAEEPKKTAEQDRIEYLIMAIEMHPELGEMFCHLIDIKMNGCSSKRDLLKFVGYTEEQINRVDSSYPIDYARKLEQVYPNFIKGIMCYDYNRAPYGEMLNIADLVAAKVLKPI